MLETKLDDDTPKNYSSEYFQSMYILKKTFCKTHLSHCSHPPHSPTPPQLIGLKPAHYTAKQYTPEYNRCGITIATSD